LPSPPDGYQIRPGRREENKAQAMPWTEPLANPDELARCIRNLVALSTLPTAWRHYDMRQIGDSIVTSLITMLAADFVLIAIPNHGGPVTELTRSNPDLSLASLDRVRTTLQREKTTLGRERAFVVANPSGSEHLHVATAPIGMGGDAVLAAGSSRETFPTEVEKLLLNAGANQAIHAFQQWLGDTDKRRFTTLVQQSTDFVGIASLDGQVQYVNPAGLQSVGLASLEAALRLRVFDFVSRRDRQMLQNELWPMVLRAGRWKGEVELVHFSSGMPIPFLIDCFRIDDPRTGEPMNVATVSRDLSAQKAAETKLRHINESLERRVAERTTELEQANRRLLAEIFERQQSDLRFHKLRNELFNAAHLTAASQMAAAIAHELNQPLTAVINSINAAKRLLGREDGGGLTTAQEVTGEAAVQAMRASEILRSLRQLVSLGDMERRTEALGSMIEESGALVLSSVAGIKAGLTFEFDENATEVFVSRIQIQQVLVNLIRNAFDAMADQNRQEVTLATQSLGNGMTAVVVSDIGPGIDGDIAGRLFEPFVSNKHDGMGLGLSISRSIVEAHGGQLTAEAKPGGGTSFRFTLPSEGTADVG
jgi:PAS domain S-box-containing protein